MGAQHRKLLFFTGGTALRELSRLLAQEQIPSIHLVTTFDSGGSTKELRRCLAIPALGDLRNRMLALADLSQVPKGFVKALEFRCPTEECNDALKKQLLSFIVPTHPMWQDVQESAATFLCSCLENLFAQLPNGFNFQGASLGNLFLAGVYLYYKRDFTPTLEYMQRLLHVRGTVLPIVDECLNLGCELLDGSFVLGQHKFKTLSSPIKDIFLTVHEPREVDHIIQEDICQPKLAKACLHWFELADLICYPMGSFYSSVLVNLLVRGVARRIQKLAVPKVFIPNVGYDPELNELTIARQVEIILNILHRDAPNAQDNALLQYVLVDSQRGDYGSRLESDTAKKLQERGIELVDLKLCAGKNSRVHDPQCTLEALSTFYKAKSHEVS
ncbi:MAG: GAK system CofD-like protein [Desulfovibrionaceae bacterium]|nr:GAK system CofD-like protein [Desulfovibrionaceae bacterium]